MGARFERQSSDIYPSAEAWLTPRALLLPQPSMERNRMDPATWTTGKGKAILHTKQRTAIPYWGS